MTLQTFFSKRYIRRIFRLCYYPYLRNRVKHNLDLIKSAPIVSEYKEKREILYLRTNLWGRTSVASGAIAHTKGVIEALVQKGKDVLVCSPNEFDYVIEPVQYELVNPDDMLSLNCGELADMEYNNLLIPPLLAKCRENKPSFIYQRYGLNNYTGA